MRDDAVEIRSHARRQVVEDLDGMSQLQEPLDQMAPDKSGAAGNQTTCHSCILKQPSHIARGLPASFPVSTSGSKQRPCHNSESLQSGHVIGELRRSAATSDTMAPIRHRKPAGPATSGDLYWMART